MSKPIMYPVSERALMQRLDRALTREEGSPMKVKKSRGGVGMSRVGLFYVLNVNRNSIGPYNLDLDDLVKMAKKHEVLADYENLVTDEDE